MIERSMRVVLALGRRSEPHLIIHFARRGGVRRRAESRHDVAVGADPRAHDLSDVAGSKQFFRLLVARAAALLHADLNYAVVLARGIDHPAAFLYEERHGLLDV